MLLYSFWSLKVYPTGLSFIYKQSDNLLYNLLSVFVVAVRSVLRMRAFVLGRTKELGLVQARLTPRKSAACGKKPKKTPLTCSSGLGDIFLSQLLTTRAPLTHNTCTLKQAGGKTLCIKTSWGPHASYFYMLFLRSLISVYTSTLCFLHYNSSSMVHKSFCFIKSHSGPPRVSTDPAADDLSWPLAFIIITLYFFQYI